MVRYVGVENMVRLIDAVGIEPYLIGLAGYIEEDFRRWNAFEKAPRVASHCDGVIELMPTRDGEFYGFKYVNGHPKNTRTGLQTVTAFGVLSDVETGYPHLLSEMTITTAMRTAATSAVAAKYLARKDAQVMAIIGLGSQSEFQALAFKAVNGIRRLRVFDIDPVERVAYAARSNRTNEVALERFFTHFNFEPVVFDAVDATGRPIYHTNVLMCVGTDFCLNGLGTIRDSARRAEIAERLAGTGRAVIDLSHEQIGEFAGNAIELQGRDGRVVAISARALKALQPQQVATLERSATILLLEVPTIELVGGSVHCMLAGIHLAPRHASGTADPDGAVGPINRHEMAMPISFHSA